jgi:hypothetical protein
MFPGQSYLSSSIARGYVNPRHQGYITGPPSVTTLPRITLDLEEVDFDGNNGRYDFEAVILGGGSAPINIDQISYISIFDFGGEELSLFANTTISTSPAWPDSTFTSDAVEPNLATAADAGTFPGITTVITFRNVPVIPNLAIQFYGNTPP